MPPAGTMSAINKALSVDEHRTKIVAERMVLEADSSTLATCAIRPAGSCLDARVPSVHCTIFVVHLPSNLDIGDLPPTGIYGEGELRHFPRIVQLANSGTFPKDPDMVVRP